MLVHEEWHSMCCSRRHPFVAWGRRFSGLVSFPGSNSAVRAAWLFCTTPDGVVSCRVPEQGRQIMLVRGVVRFWRIAWSSAISSSRPEGLRYARRGVFFYYRIGTVKRSCFRCPGTAIAYCLDPSIDDNTFCRMHYGLRCYKQNFVPRLSTGSKVAFS